MCASGPQPQLLCIGTQCHLFNQIDIFRYMNRVFISQTLVCILSDIKFDFVCFLWGYLGGGATNQHEILHDGRYGSQTGLLSFGGTPKLPQHRKF